MNPKLGTTMLVLLMLYGFFGCSQSSVSGFASDGLWAHLDDLVSSGVPGVVLHVSHNGEFWTGVAGYAKVEDQTPLTANDSFPIFSITKTFTAVVVLQLIEDGRLSLDDKLGDLLGLEQGVGPVGKIPHSTEFTIRQLLNHSSGVFDYPNGMDYLQATLGPDADYSKEWTMEELLSYAHPNRNEPTGLPGQLTSYSSTGFDLLGLVIEEITGQRLAEVFRDRIFDPVGMPRSYLAGFGDESGPDVTGYVMLSDDIRAMGLATEFPVAKGDLVNSSKGRRSRQAAEGAAGGIISTVDELAKFSYALFDGNLLSAKMLLMMVTPYPPADGSTGSDEAFGLGLRILKVGTRSWILMLGNGAGGESVLGREMESGLTFIGLTNVFAGGVAENIFQEIQDRLEMG